jgi:Uma2 family endonuclease
MNTSVADVEDEVVYPESDGKPMADNTLQWDWMVKIVGELKEMFANQDVFVAGNLFWYPVKGDPNTVTAPDALVVFGRPSGYRGSYKQWEEDDIAPQVVFEILSPNNTREEMNDKLAWYSRYGVHEYYFIDPYKNQLTGWVRSNGELRSVYPMAGFVSPLLKIRFDVNGEVVIYRPDGREFQTREDRVADMELLVERERIRAKQERVQAEEARLQAEEARVRAEQASLRAERERLQAEEASLRAEEASRRAEQLAARLRELGINPDDLPK